VCDVHWRPHFAHRTIPHGDTCSRKAVGPIPGGGGRGGHVQTLCAGNETRTMNHGLYICYEVRRIHNGHVLASRPIRSYRYTVAMFPLPYKMY
jgi:hypothetical protein